MPAFLDHASTTPLRPEAAAAVVEELGHVGNASSLHSSGRRARRVVEESREALAEAVGAGVSEVVLTSGGTEADNLGVKGLYWARRAADPRRRRILAGAVEHHAVLDVVEWLAEHEGAEVTWLPVDTVGRVDLDALAAVLAEHADEVALLTLMWANNEVGTLQPVQRAAELAHAAGVPVHTDAVQAVGHVPVDFAASGADSLALSAHKFGGPVGAGALVLRRGLDLVAVQHGGGQERGVRSGTLDVPSVRGMAVAAAAAVAELGSEARRLGALRDELVAGLLDAVPGVVVRGDPDPAGRLPGHAHVTVPDCEGDSLLYLLDARGVECSTGSACQAGVPRPSHVLLAMGLDPLEARGALRFSLGRTTTAADVEAAVAAFAPAVERAQRATRAARTRRAS
ncbi:cysteine desulfurase [Kineococcus xinjiangensis]|uniref:Cysteine desulfurase n=1 Tax=Kineococcus xinjiangensis TaxID=512762 RepID=A0A2S6IWU5_9ACTN|nr:cysteine desulfurase family protein [Kineococcus xinjiangensis]PPK98631.1 cysteine desulfurase [Kineococcus xinjiangensis]